jgi:hypothetical protein
MSDIKEFVQTYLLPYGAKPPTRIIALHQYYARIAADTAGIKSVESEDYKVVNDPINDCAIIWCTVRGYYEETQP